MGLLLQPMTRIGLACIGASCLALLATSGPAGAAEKRIRGTLSKPGYTVLALAANGTVKAVRVREGPFRLAPPAGSVTLHLRSPNGVYAGPVVVGTKKRGRRAVVGVKSGARLGRVRIRRGYAKTSKRLRRRWVDATRTARARRGVPIGARVFGRVGSRLPRRPVSGDTDFDGIPDPLDIDDDGDLVLDTVDRSGTVRGAQARPPPHLSVLPLLDLSLPQTANANHPALVANIDTALPQNGRLILGAAPPFGGSAELDCAGDPTAEPPRPGLAYCSAGGTGRLSAPPMPDYPECCDPDGDGFGTIPPFMGPPQLAHGATTGQIKTGDVLIAHINDAGDVEVGAYSQLLPYVFATVPALVSYDDDGPSGEDPTPLSYPYSTSAELLLDPRPPGDPDAGDVVVTFRFWRPQRTRIAADPEPQAGESATWTDIGGLGYVAGLGAGECPASVFSEDDPNLTDQFLPLGAASAFSDSRRDQPANPGATLSFTMNLTRCLEMQGLASSFDEPGEVRMFHLVAAGGGRADQTANVERR
jgi:hypothetical protein